MLVLKCVRNGALVKSESVVDIFYNLPAMACDINDSSSPLVYLYSYTVHAVYEPGRMEFSGPVCATLVFLVNEQVFL